MTLLESDALVLKQISVITRNDFTITDAQGAPVGTVSTEGSLAGRLLKGSRKFTVSDADGQMVLAVNDKPNVLRDRIDILSADGQPAGQLIKRFTLVRRMCTLELPDGRTLKITGSIMGFNFTVTEGDTEVAQVRRSYDGIGSIVLDHDSYLLQFAEAVPQATRAAIIGAVIGIDLMAQKEKSTL